MKAEYKEMSKHAAHSANLLRELGFNDEPWDENLKQSILWKNHTPDQENMNYIYKP